MTLYVCRVESLQDSRGAAFVYDWQPPESLPDSSQTSSTCAPILLYVLKKYEVNRTKIKGCCQSYTKAAPWESWSDSTLVTQIALILMDHSERCNILVDSFVSHWPFDISFTKKTFRKKAQIKYKILILVFGWFVLFLSSNNNNVGNIFNTF